ncbi:MAG: TetR/AcrR family transcriptional regulator [Anaerolineaceae bacterium]|jgi:AcrR family transcriptional regulator|nr:TetR/AcrR family transcriptional regulator [Anaerolineae bacterium]MDX9833056.1 TetR/AcrR family transcriptional regulator [Anaerolineae bacterium]NLF14046.1 TetR/AcrR family transcriptional regulator [Anaerolineaceae bacterium]
MSAKDHGVAGEIKGELPAGVAADATRERILRAAADLFAERGYLRATTRALAAAAGVNEVTLFRHFGNKLNLLAAVVHEWSGLPDLAALLEGRLTGDYRHDMLRVGHVLHAMFAGRRSAMRLVLCEAAQVPELQRVLGQTPLQLRQVLAGYLRQQIAAGRVRPLDPEVMAQAFFGLFFAYNVSEVLVPARLAPGMSVDAVVEQFVDLFVSGTIHRP